MIDASIEKEYGNRIRLRTAGILTKDDKVLLVNHSRLNTQNEFWAPPGGGLQFDETVIDCLKREFIEETGLQVEIEKFLCITEYLNPPLHAVELFFKVRWVAGDLKRGIDPEMAIKDQIIKNVKFLSFNDLLNIPDGEKHRIFHGVTNLEDLLAKNGYSKFP